MTAWDIAGTYAFLGTTTSVPFVLNWVKQQFVQNNPPPPDETTWDVRLPLGLSPSIIEGLEARREGQDFRLQIDTTVLLIDGGEPTRPRDMTYYGTHPTRSSQDTLFVRQAEWGTILEQWQRAVGIPILLPLPATDPHPQRAEIVRHVKDARQKVDGGDYAGSFASSRKALEVLRAISPATTPLPRDARDRDFPQRLHAVIDALFGLASASPHVDGPVKDFDPKRADAMALAGATASLAQDVFAWLR